MNPEARLQNKRLADYIKHGINDAKLVALFGLDSTDSSDFIHCADETKDVVDHEKEEEDKEENEDEAVKPRGAPLVPFSKEDSRNTPRSQGWMTDIMQTLLDGIWDERVPDKRGPEDMSNCSISMWYRLAGYHQLNEWDSLLQMALDIINPEVMERRDALL